ncbi:uncharacterized protein BO87DRAFT_58757 [Aspergillus neoniger CBS 115656]|uniref:F-box domain-containing protein n=1 Tax=Aspergillus neoniger (strain CBS 115656) TaxID=1448310 RepID=A0A318YPB6_ASPNB|nr:hypothetical protein BO87DRAFT_58757 [Aspergillus neoniger CBS 115656]PYH33910.1 hypothetical protein BO87DRAFT_58757 [Aspergillus neoniger CBS 115656]
MDLPVYSTSQPSLCALPVELIQAILCNLPDLESLKSAQLTHSALYFAFIGAESQILKQILAQKIPTALLPDAFFAFDASTVEGVWTQDEVHSIIYRHRTRQISSSFPLSPQSTFKITELYRWVRHFTRHFLRQAIADPMQGRTHPPMPLYQPTSSEECRVARALYRFEIHRHLFRMREPYANYSKCSPDFLISDQWGYYFRHFPAWELEQILSVSEYLFRRVAKCGCLFLPFPRPGHTSSEI